MKIRGEGVEVIRETADDWGLCLQYLTQELSNLQHDGMTAMQQTHIPDDLTNMQLE